jgi:hypothetical protein
MKHLCAHPYTAFAAWRLDVNPANPAFVRQAMRLVVVSTAVDSITRKAGVKAGPSGFRRGVS